VSQGLYLTRFGIKCPITGFGCWFQTSSSKFFNYSLCDFCPRCPKLLSS